MPFPKWSVEPVLLSRRVLPPDKKPEFNDFDETTHLTFVNVLRQLASVAKIADRIFVEIANDCRLLGERTEKLSEKLSSFQDAVDNLNAREVIVPVSNLDDTAKRLKSEKPFVSRCEQTTQLFLPSTRPPCIDGLYQKAYTSPVAVMCTIDQYRTDGLSASELFMVTPVLGGTRKKRRRLLDIETRKPANFSLVRTKQDRILSGSASLPPLVSPSFGYTLKQNENLELERLPSPEEQAMLVSLEYPSVLVPVDTTGRSFSRMSTLRRSLIHADFVIKRKKRKSKRRHTICESREIEKALRDTSCQTEEVTSDSSSAATLVRRPSFLTRRRSRSVQDNSSRRRSLLDDTKDSATEEEKSQVKSSTATLKKSKSRSYNFNPISSISAALSLAAVKMRNSTRKGDDGCRSSSGNWSASSSTRASVDSDPHQAADGPPSRNSVGKDSVLSDATHLDTHNRSRDDILPIQSLTCSPIKARKYPSTWDGHHGRVSSTPTPDHVSQCSSSTPLVRSPYAGRRGINDDGESSVYSVDTDGYYTSMHTDSGLWTNAVVPTLKSEDVIAEIGRFRERKESQSSASSINSFLSKSATECDSTCDSLKRESPAIGQTTKEESKSAPVKQELNGSDKSDSPHPHNGSASESEHEVQDRIRAKTTITPHRYPSMCAVSPETSDEEVAELKKCPSPNVNVVVAEIHREDTSKNDSVVDSRESPISRSSFLSSNTSSSISMYRSETPGPSTFSSTLPQNLPVCTSTPRSGIHITTFSPDSDDSARSPSKPKISDTSVRQSPCKSNNSEEIVVTEQPSSPLTKNKCLIPLKYAQKITVTPIARKDSASSKTGTILRSPLFQHSPKTERSIVRNTQKTDTSPTYVSFKAPDSPASSVISVASSISEKPVSSPSNSLTRPVARVTLDPTGKVVYASNSLERTGNNRPSEINAISRSYATMPKHPTQSAQNRIPDLSVNGSRLDSPDQNVIPRMNHNSGTYISHNQEGSNFSSFKSANSNDFKFRPNRGGRFCRSYFPSHLISTNLARGDHQSSSYRSPYPPAISSIPENNPAFFSPCESSAGQNNSRVCPEITVARNHAPTTPITSSLSHSSVPNPPKLESEQSVIQSRVWPVRSYFSPIRHQDSGFLKQSPPDDPFSRPSFTSFTSLSPPDLIPSGESPPSTLDITSSAGANKKPSDQNSPEKMSPREGSLKSLSANELFAIIHNSKKKHNIKTESERSLSPLSSRSVSPALSQSSFSRPQPVETGVLTKRGDVTSPDNSKRCNSVPEKLASKPTSMRDFKMLLLQTRTGSSSGSARPSAAELLKVSPPKNSPCNNSKPSTSKVQPSHHSSGLHYSPGHGSSKRNLRTRSPYLTRYDSAYPPIIEDWSEESESYNDQCLTSNPGPYSGMSNVTAKPEKATSTWV